MANTMKGGGATRAPKSRPRRLESIRREARRIIAATGISASIRRDIQRALEHGTPAELRAEVTSYNEAREHAEAIGRRAHAWASDFYGAAIEFYFNHADDPAAISMAEGTVKGALRTAPDAADHLAAILKHPKSTQSFHDAVCDLLGAVDMDRAEILRAVLLEAKREDDEGPAATDTTMSRAEYAAHVAALLADPTVPDYLKDELKRKGGAK